MRVLPAAFCAAQGASKFYLSYTQRAILRILRFFAAHGQHVAPMRVKFGTEEWAKDALFHAKFHPIGATIMV